MGRVVPGVRLLLGGERGGNEFLGGNGSSAPGAKTYGSSRDEGEDVWFFSPMETPIAGHYHRTAVIRCHWSPIPVTVRYRCPTDDRRMTSCGHILAWDFRVVYRAVHLVQRSLRVIIVIPGVMTHIRIDVFL